MAKKIREIVENSLNLDKANSETVLPFLADRETVDPSLANLFASSAGPVKPPSQTRYSQPPPKKGASIRNRLEDSSGVRSKLLDEENEELSSFDGDLGGAGSAFVEKVDYSNLYKGLPPYSNEIANPEYAQTSSRKRKRLYQEDDLEGNYMLRIAKEEEEEEEARQAERLLKRQKVKLHQGPGVSDGDQDLEGELESQKLDDSGADETEADLSYVPEHETLALGNDAIELEKSSRTVFLANVSTTAITDKKAKKRLLDHMASFLETLPVQDGKGKHKIESIRFRSTAYAGGGLPKKAAFATKKLMGETTKSTNAYVVYSTAFAAREAVKRLNGTMVLERHLRVDGVAHPAKIDHRRCVFVGNLGFVDDESTMDDGGENERKRSKIPSDVEEGLWRQFSKVGAVESVRVVRDEKTRVGKGFAYVQFEDANSVEAALLFHDKKYPPMLPRVLRVTRAKAIKKTALASKQGRANTRPLPNGSGNPNRERIYNPKVSGQYQSLQGRATKLLGRAGAARFKKIETQPNGRLEGIARTPEEIVFEGYRASQKTGAPKGLKLGGGGGGKKKGKPHTRSSKRASDWKKSSGKKAR